MQAALEDRLTAALTGHASPTLDYVYSDYVSMFLRVLVRVAISVLYLVRGGEVNAAAIPAGTLSKIYIDCKTT